VPLRIFVVPPWALLTDHVAYGDGLVAFGFIRELAARGHDLHVATAAVDLKGPLPANVHLHALGQDDEPRALERVALMLRARRLYRRLERERAFDLVHQLNPVEVGVSLALPRHAVPLVLGPYVPDWAPSARVPGAVVNPAALRAKRIVRAAQQRRATMVLLSTPAAASKIDPRAASRLLVRELSPGIDERAWRPAGDGDGTDPPAAAAGQDVLFLANLNVRKGVHAVLDAFERVAPDLPQARLLIGGVGTELDRVRRRIETTPALARAELLGRVERDRVLATLQACDVYCLPSDGEPFGMTALEAMACAKPVVVTDAGGLRHLVPDEGGRKVPNGDTDALAGALREVLTDSALRRAMGGHNRRAVEDRYAWSRVVDRLEGLYEEAIRRQRATVPAA
jgi:glycosyltransferase involved in cell wall biosynthesis